MKQNKDMAGADRRGFLKMLSVGAISGSALLSTGSSKAEAAQDEGGKKGLYKETEHVKTYYELAKF